MNKFALKHTSKFIFKDFNFLFRLCAPSPRLQQTPVVSPCPYKALFGATDPPTTFSIIIGPALIDFGFATVRTDLRMKKGIHEAWIYVHFVVTITANQLRL